MHNDHAQGRGVRQKLKTKSGYYRVAWSNVLWPVSFIISTKSMHLLDDSNRNETNRKRHRPEQRTCIPLMV